MLILTIIVPTELYNQEIRTGRVRHIQVKTLTLLCGLIFISACSSGDSGNALPDRDTGHNTSGSEGGQSHSGHGAPAPSGSENSLDASENLALIKSNATRNTQFDENRFYGVPISDIAVSDLTVDYDAYVRA